MELKTPEFLKCSQHNLPLKFFIVQENKLYCAECHYEGLFKKSSAVLAIVYCE